MAAAIAAVDAGGGGHHATVFEASRTVGGRARAIVVPSTQGAPLVLDNGQHLLIGAYTESLRLMRHVGVDIDTAFLRLPLTLRFPDGSGLQWPDMRPPWNAVWGIVRAHGWHWRDQIALLRTLAQWKSNRFKCPPESSVADVCSKLPPRLMAQLIEPLCVAALNTPAHAASGQVFLRVLKDSLLSGQGGSDFLLPRTNLGEVFPEAAARWLRDQGSIVRTGTRVRSLMVMPQSGRWIVDGTPFDAVILATPNTEAARIVSRCAQTVPYSMAVPLCDWAASAQALQFEAIATVYVQCPVPESTLHSGGGSDSYRLLKHPILTLHSNAQHPAQFVFDRGQLGGPAGLLAFVVSAAQGDKADIEQQVLHQAQEMLELELGLDFNTLQALRVVQTVVEKRATFACTPALQRPTAKIAPGLWACGDYLEGPYPATLEAAMRHGTAAGQSAVAGCS